MTDLKTRALDPSQPAIERLLFVMRILRSPGGCAWDRAQTHDSLIPYLIEEAYEAIDAIHAGDIAALREELGDVLCQIVFHAQLADERSEFDFSDVAATLVDKLVARHPHVFDTAAELDPQQVRDQWERLKAEGRGENPQPRSVLDGLPKSMPALTMAFRIGEKAGGLGFDWADAPAVVAKVREELDEIAGELAQPEMSTSQSLEMEIGDLLFAAASLARKSGIDPESALKRSLEKFRQRFRWIEKEVASESRRLSDLSAAQWDVLWEQSKSAPENA